MRLIDADKLKKDINSRFLTNGEKRLLCRIVDKVPTVEQKESEHFKDCIIAYGDGFESARRLFERPHGRWITNYVSQFPNPGRSCSLCNKTVEFSENFCPNCGADMRKGGA